MSNAQADLKTLLEKPVLIYGAGRGATMIILNLKALNANIIGLAVSDISDSRIVGFEGYDVKTPEAYESYKDSVVVLIATSDRYHDEIKSTCMRLGFRNMVLYSQALMECAAISAHEILFKKHGLSLTDDVIVINGGKYLNPFSKVFPQKFGVVNQWADICSTVFGDMSMSCEGPYEYGKINISDGDIALDIGANVGYVSAYAVSKGADVFAFEPISSNHQLINRHSELNGNKIHLEPYAVSDKCETTEFWINPDCAAGSSLDDYIGGGKSPITVSQITVDEFVRQKQLKRVDYIHANIMGAERSMLQGAQETLRNFAPKIAICAYQNHDDKEELANLILKGNSAYRIEYKLGKLYAHK